MGVGLLVVVAVLGYIYLSGGSGEPSAEVTAPTIASQATEPTQAARGIAGSVTYDIDKSLSSVRFELDELLGGNPNRVVGSTSEVAGQVRIDFEDPANSQVGTIVINVRTLVTDSDLRDRVMRGPILGSSDDANEFAEFNPTSLEGLPDAVAIGDTVSFTVTGDFLLSGVTNEVTFDVELVVVAADRIEVTGSATVLRSDFGLTIPEVPRVAGVTDEIDLVINFVAVSS